MNIPTRTPTTVLTPTPTLTPSITPTFTATPVNLAPLVIDYQYDPLYRLKNATYSGQSTSSFQYTYDAVGNRLTQTIDGATTNYGYDNANRLMNGVSYSWDNNGNLLNDGVNAYAYDQANRLIGVGGQGAGNSFGYNGVGDRLRQTVGGVTTNYALDLNAGLTQVLADGTNTYLYGVGRIGQYDTTMQYFGADGLGSVRQIYNASGIVRRNTLYDPFGNVLTTNGTAASVYGYTGEQTDATGLVFLRARYYAPGQGRFMTRDVWEGDSHSPLSFNKWSYTENNPINYTDPTGFWAWQPATSPRETLIEIHYMGGDLKNKQLEYRIPLFEKDRRNMLRIDMFNSSNGNVYEIEPIDDRVGPNKGVLEARTKTAGLMVAAVAGHLKSPPPAPDGSHYDWNKTIFGLGNGSDWPGMYRFPDALATASDLVAIYWEPGLVVWWLEPDEPTKVPTGEKIRFPRNVREKGWSRVKEQEYERNGRQWLPSPVPVPISPIIILPHPGLFPLPLFPQLRIAGGLGGGCPAKIH